MNKVVLVVDDMSDERKLVKLLLRRYNCTLVEAANGMDAVKQAKKFNPSLVLMDHLMPIMNGYECVHEFRKDPDLRSIPVIMLTSRHFDDGFKEFIRFEVDSFLQKPVEPSALLTAIQKVLGPLEARAGAAPAKAAV